MLWAEERDKLNAGRVKKLFDRRAAECVEPCVISDKSNMFAAERREFFCFENVNSCLHAAGAARFFHGGMRGNAESENEYETCQNADLFLRTSFSMTLGQSIPSGCASPMIFWNASFGAAL